MGSDPGHEGVAASARVVWCGVYGPFYPDAGVGVAAVWAGGDGLGIETLF